MALSSSQMQRLKTWEERVNPRKVNKIIEIWVIEKHRRQLEKCNLNMELE